MTTSQEAARLKKELVLLFGHMNRVRRELATLQGNDETFASMADTLDAIVGNTESASNTILECMEAIEEMVGELRAKNDPETTAVCERITDRCNQVFEACSFQDLTGQRITRVVRELKFIEERVGAMVRMWGRDELAKVIDEVKKEKEAAAPAQGDGALLHGPQRASVAINQEDVDKLFSQDDIDKLFG